MRGALDARGVAAALAAGVREAGHVGVEHPVADGGEGSRDAIVAAVPGACLVPIDSVDAVGRPTCTAYGVLPGGTAIVEAADVIGLGTLRPEERDIFAASSAGLAAPIKAAVASGARQVVVQLGGTATMDGGLGLLAALGAELRDERGTVLSGTGEDLTRVAAVDLTPARQTVSDVDLVVATDVRSPMFGPLGAAHVFAPQKGADPDAVLALDAGLGRLAPFLGGAPTTPGAGAAGGLGAALHALGGRIVGGADLVLGLTRFEANLSGASLCLTAEGQVDAGSAAGKAVSAVLAACQRAGVPCVILAGAGEADDDLYAAGAAAVLAIGRRPRDTAGAFAATRQDLRGAALAITTLTARAHARALSQRTVPRRASTAARPPAPASPHP